MNTSTLNLLAWREKKIMNQLTRDFLFFIVLSGLLALFLEFCLILLNFYSQYDSKKLNFLSHNAFSQIILLKIHSKKN